LSTGTCSRRSRSGQPTTTPCSDRHLAVAVRRGSPPRWAVRGKVPHVPHARTDAPAARGHRALCSQDPRAKVRIGTAAATARTEWVTAVGMCN
jgi:hypothetical protein